MLAPVLGRRKNGSAFPMGLSVGTSKQNGQSIFVGMIHDLTERERAEQSLRESAAKLRGVNSKSGPRYIVFDDAPHDRSIGWTADQIA